MSDKKSLGIASGIVVAVLTSAATTSLINIPSWQWQQRKLQEWNSRPVVDIALETGKDAKRLVVRNLGQIPIEDIRVYGTTYRLKERHIDGGAHVTFDGIDSVSRVGLIVSHPGLTAQGERAQFDLLSDAFRITPQYVWNPSQPAYDGVFYAFRLTFRHGLTKQRYAHYVLSTPYRDFNANLFEASETGTEGGGYASWQHMYELRQMILKDQMERFDDLSSEMYRR